MTELFGEDVYQDLLDDLVDYSSKPTWTDEGNYVLNDIVCYEGEYFKLLVPQNTTSDAPNCSVEWELAPKFTTACHNEMYDNGVGKGKLKKLLCWRIFSEAVPFYPEVLGAAGFTGNDKEYREKTNYFLNPIKSNIAKMRKIFLRWNDLHGCIPINVCSDKSETPLTNRAILGY